MPVKIRLARRGRKKRPFYHIVVADARAPRDGRFIEKIGTYDPLTKPATIEIDRDKAFEWLMNGAQPTDTARAILRFKGVLYRKHLMRGVQKGALTEEEAMAKYEAWVAEKEAKIKKRRDESIAEKQAFHAAVSGVIPKIKIKEEAPVEETTAEVKEEADSPEAPTATKSEEQESSGKEETETPEAEQQEEAKAPEADTKPAEEAKVEATPEAKPEPEVADAAVETESKKEAPKTQTASEAKPEVEEPAAEADTEGEAEKEEAKAEATPKAETSAPESTPEAKKETDDDAAGVDTSDAKSEATGEEE